MIFTWHPPKAARNLKDHGVSFEEARTVFDDPLYQVWCDDLHSFDEARYYCIGQSAQGRWLTISYTERGEDRIHLISAREATRREKKRYESSDDLT